MLIQLEDIIQIEGDRDIRKFFKILMKDREEIELTDRELLILIPRYASFLVNVLFDRELNLENADLNWTYLMGARLWRSNLRGAQMEHAYLMYADFTDADLTGANLFCANLEQTNCVQTRFTGANLENAHFDDAYIRDCSFQRAKIRWATGLDRYLRTNDFTDVEE